MAILSILGLILVTSSFADQTHNQKAKKRRQQNAAAAKERQEEAALRAARAQKAAAEKVLAAAEAKGADAKAKLDSALARLKAESDEFHDAQSTGRHLAKELAEIEQEILDEQTPTSEYAKAASEVETTRAALVKVEERILSESGVQSQLAGLSGVQLTEKQQTIMNGRPDYIAARTALELAAAKIARIRDQLFQNDADWKEASAALAQARKDEEQAQANIRGPTSGRISTAKTAKTAEEAATQARAAIAEADRVIKSIENKRKNDGSPKKKGKR